MRRSLRHDDEGTVLVLILGLVSVVALLAAVVTDVSALYLQRRDLVSAADGAALAGAQAVDEATLYTEGLPASGPLPLDEEAARAVVHEYLADAGAVSAPVDGLPRLVHATLEMRMRRRLIGGASRAPVSRISRPMQRAAPGA